MIRSFVLAVLLLVAPLAAAQPAADPAQEREARQIESMVIAPCCFSQQVSVHQSPAADQMKKEIRLMLAAGQTRQQILEAFVAQHGEQILAEPPARKGGVKVADVDELWKKLHEEAKVV